MFLVSKVEVQSDGMLANQKVQLLHSRHGHLRNSYAHGQFGLGQIILDGSFQCQSMVVKFGGPLHTLLLHMICDQPLTTPPRKGNYKGDKFSTAPRLLRPWPLLRCWRSWRERCCLVWHLAWFTLTAGPIGAYYQHIYIIWWEAGMPLRNPSKIRRKLEKFSKVSAMTGAFLFQAWRGNDSLKASRLSKGKGLYCQHCFDKMSAAVFPTQGFAIGNAIQSILYVIWIIFWRYIGSSTKGP